MILQKLRRPKPLTILLNGQKQTLDPSYVGMKELKRLYQWLGKYIQYWEQK